MKIRIEQPTDDIRPEMSPLDVFRGEQIVFQKKKFNASLLFHYR
jgi:hypothetical protein